MVRRVWDKEKVIEAVKRSISIREVFARLGFPKDYGSINRKFKILREKWNLDTSHFLGKGYLKGQICPWVKAFPLEDILCNNRKTNSNSLRKRLLEQGIFEAKCYNCNLTDWLDGPIPLELEHINGIHDDNRLINLTILCPNCHAKTPTYRGKNKKINKSSIKKFGDELTVDNELFLSLQPELAVKIRRPRRYKVPHPSKEELSKFLWEMPTSQLAIKLGVSDKAIEKWAKGYGIDKPPRGYWAKIKAGEKSNQND